MSYMDPTARGMDFYANETDEERRRRLGLPTNYQFDQAQLAAGPAATAQMRPSAPAAPGPQAQPGLTESEITPGYSYGAPGAGQPFMDYGQALSAGARNPRELSRLAYDDAAPDWVRREAGTMLYNNLKLAKDTEQASQRLREQVESGDMIGFAKELSRAGKEGSITKAVIYNFMNMPDLAKQERIKLGAGQEWQNVMGPGGKTATVLFSGDGLPLRGYTQDGITLTQQELAGLGAAPSGRASSGLQNLRDPVTGDLYYVRQDRGRNILMGYNSQAPLTDPEVQRRLVVDTAGSNIQLQNTLQLQKLRNQLLAAPQEEHARLVQKHNADYGTNLPLTMNPQRLDELMQQFRQVMPGAIGGYGAPQQQPAPQPEPQRRPGMTESEIMPGYGGTPPPPAPLAPVAPARRSAVAPVQMAQADMGTMTDVSAPMTGPIAPGEEVQVAQAQPGSPAAMRSRQGSIEAGEREASQAAGKTLAGSQETINTIEKGKQYLEILKKGDHNFGSALAFTGMLGGGMRGPIAQAVGKQFETEDSKNTQLIMDYIAALAAEGLKTLGSNPSTVDLQFWTANKPNESSSPEFVRAWTESRLEDLKRRIGYTERTVQSGGGAGAAREQPRSRPGTQANPIRLD